MEVTSFPRSFPDMAWGYRLKKLSRREKTVCRSLGRDCAAPGCGDDAEYISNYSYVSVHGTATHAKRTFCTDHARAFAMRHTLAWPAQAAKVHIRLFDVPRVRAA
jgi:hypothetical protein